MPKKAFKDLTNAERRSAYRDHCIRREGSRFYIVGFRTWEAENRHFTPWRIYEVPHRVRGF